MAVPRAPGTRGVGEVEIRPVQPVERAGGREAVQVEVVGVLMMGEAVSARARGEVTPMTVLWCFLTTMWLLLLLLFLPMLVTTMLGDMGVVESAVVKLKMGGTGVVTLLPDKGEATVMTTKTEMFDRVAATKTHWGNWPLFDTVASTTHSGD